MKRKGYISIFALLIGLLLFTIITFMIVSIRSHNRISTHQLSMEQERLKGESIAAFLLEDEIKMKYFKDLLENDKAEEVGTTPYSNETLGVHNLIITHKKISGNELQLSFKIEGKGIKQTFNFHLLSRDLPIPALEEETPFHAMDSIEMEELLSSITLNSLTRIEDKAVLFSQEGNVYTIDEEDYLALLEKYEESENPEALWQEARESGKPISGPVFMDGERILFAGIEEINMEGIAVDRGDTRFLAKTNWNGMYFNYENNVKENLSVFGKLLGENSGMVLEFKQEFMDPYKNIFRKEKELIYHTSYSY